MPETFCVQCGTTLPEGSGFCPSCGNKAPQVPIASPTVQPVVTPTPVGYSQPQMFGPPPTNGQAVAGFVLSLVGLFLSFLVIPVILAIVFSSIGISKAKEIEAHTGQARGRGLAIAGLVISLISAFGLFIWLLI